MKKYNKIFILILALFLSVVLAGCNGIEITDKQTTTTQGGTATISTTISQDGTTIAQTTEGGIALPDLTNKSTSEVKQILDNLGLNYKLVIKSGLFYSEGEGVDKIYEYEKFYGYASKSHTPGTIISPTKKFNVYITAYNIANSLEELVEQHPELQSEYAKVNLDGKTYDGQDFMTTGCATVTVQSFVDGDTTHFKDSKGNLIKLRYLGVDTPESTALFEPWGKAASNYTKESLQSAKKVVLTADTPGQVDGNGRALGWVWYQDSSDKWHLLNLELIALGYTKDKASSDSTFGELATEIGSILTSTGRRVWGEGDPSFDYSTDPYEITIKELKEHYPKYYSRKVKVTGVIALLDSGRPVLVDPETGDAIYYYTGFAGSSITYNLKEGNKVQMEGVASYYGGSDDDELDLDTLDESLGCPQLTGLSSDTQIVLISEGNSVSPQTLNVADIKPIDLCKYCKFENLTITKVYEAKTKSGTTITCKDTNNNTLTIRVSNQNYLTTKEGGVDMTKIVKDKVIQSVTGYLSIYAEQYQLVLVYGKDIIIN